MSNVPPGGHWPVICRIGSLENIFRLPIDAANVICRIGSLENVICSLGMSHDVICRIGSLEIEKIKEADKK